jgi:hypothetical protein
MSKLLAAGLCALFITGSSLAYAQTPVAGDRAAAAADARAAAAERVKQLLSVDWKALADLRVATEEPMVCRLPAGESGDRTVGPAQQNTEGGG